MNKNWRALAGIVLVLFSTVMLDACGRKEKLTPPQGSDYPRQYPRE